MNVNYATRSFMIVRKFFNVWLQVVLWNLNVNYVARDLLTQIPRECKKELNTSYKSSQSYSRGWETDCTLCSFEPTMKVKWCQRCKSKQRRSIMVATPPVSPAICQVEFLVKVLMRREWNVQWYQRWKRKQRRSMVYGWQENLRGRTCKCCFRLDVIFVYSREAVLLLCLYWQGRPH